MDTMSLEDVVGQTRAKKKLALFAMTFKKEKRIPNLGVWAGAGQGKTTLVRAWVESLNISEGMRQNADMIYINGTALKDIISLRECFEKANEYPATSFLIFIDEAHGLKKDIQTAMLSMLESPYILTCTAPRDVGAVKTPEGITRFIEKGDILREQVPENISFALASTDRYKLIAPLVDRLRHVELDEYTQDEVVDIARRNMTGMVPHDHLMGLAKRHRSVRHLIEELCTTYAEIVSAYGGPDIDMLDDVLGIDADGASHGDIAYMKYVGRHGPVGVDNIANFLSKDIREIKENLEPFLLKKGWVKTGGRGRMLTEDGKRKIGMLI
jgi:holliday junction DNA helicase RuvB